MPLVFSFDHKHRQAPMEMKDLLGGKGANLAEMTSVLGLPVPPGFTITTDACRAYLDGGWPASLDGEVAKAVRKVEKAMGKKLGDPADPLLVSVRSGAKFSMPGMMDTVLNLGLNDESVEGLAAQTGDARFAYDSYRRFISMYGRIVLDLEGDDFDRLLDTAKEKDGVTDDAKVSAATLRRLCKQYKDLVEKATGKPFPQDPIVQLRGAIEAVFQSWGGARAIAYRERERIPHDLGTAVNVQTMVFGNRDDNSGTGVGFTRDASTGENKPYGDFLVNAQGEDVVAGIRNTEDLDALAQQVPEDPQGAARDLRPAREALPRHVRHRVHHRAGQALDAPDARRQAHRRRRAAHGRRDDQAEGLEDQPDARRCMRVEADHLDQVLHPQFEGGDKKVIAKGLAASPGRRGRPGVLHRRRRRRRVRARREGDPRPQRDLARGRARHAGGRGHPHRARRPGEPRRGRRPRLGHPGRASAPTP